MRTVIYARYSAGPKQTDQSIEGQLRVCKDYCAQKGLQVIGEYCDRHISGRTDERPEFQRLIADAKKKKFEAVCVYKTDRFARNKYDSAIYKRELKRCGVQIYYAAESIPDGPEGIILESLMEGLAEYYSAELAQKIRRGMHESALKCKSTGPGCPFGYKTDKDKYFIPDPDTEKYVRDIFDLYIKRTPTAEICRYLNSRGLRTKQGNLFTDTSINYIIKNRKYIGEYRYDDVVIPDGIPSIISKEVFAMAQAEKERRRTRKPPREPKAEYLLSGKLACGHCKTPMIGVSGTSRNGNRFYYYYCPNNRGRNRTCEKEHVNRDWLEDLVARAAIEYILQPDTLEDIVKKVFSFQAAQNAPDRDLELYSKKLSENRKAIQNVIKAIENGVLTKNLPARLQELEEEQTVLEGEIAYLKSKQPEFSEDQILFMMMQYADKKDGETDQEYRRRVISCFVSEVYLWNDRIMIFFNVTGPDGKLKSVDLDRFEQGCDSSTRRITGRTRIEITSYGFVLCFILPKKS